MIPLVSIGMPVYNEGVYLNESIESLLKQTYKNIEIIISDNCSTDNTWTVIKEYMGKDRRIRSYKQEVNLGAIFNFAFVVEKAKGNYFMWAAGHDKWAEDMVEKCITRLLQNENIGLVSPRTIWINMEGKAFKENKEEIDTRLSNTAAGRVLNMYTQMKRGSSIYGIFNIHTLKKSLNKMPKIIGSDLLFLLRIASCKNIISCADALWYRRQNRTESRNRDTYMRQVKDLKVSGFAAKFPLTVSRILTIKEIFGFKGKFIERLKLDTFSIWRLFLRPSQLKLIMEDLYHGLF